MGYQRRNNLPLPSNASLGPLQKQVVQKDRESERIREDLVNKESLSCRTGYQEWNRQYRIGRIRKAEWDR
jgi:hypothetical protein